MTATTTTTTPQLARARQETHGADTEDHMSWRQLTGT